jgi:hypothetical protein
MITNPLEGDKNIPNTFKKKKKLLLDRKKKTLENLIYLGFNHNDLSDLPAYLEAPQILITVTSSMNFEKSFLRLFTPIIRSEASNAILSDAFWWFYIKYFKVSSFSQILAIKIRGWRLNTFLLVFGFFLRLTNRLKKTSFFTIQEYQIALWLCLSV